MCLKLCIRWHNTTCMPQNLGRKCWKHHEFYSMVDLENMFSWYTYQCSVEIALKSIIRTWRDRGLWTGNGSDCFQLPGAWLHAMVCLSVAFPHELQFTRKWNNLSLWKDCATYSTHWEINGLIKLEAMSSVTIWDVSCKTPWLHLTLAKRALCGDTELKRNNSSWKAGYYEMNLQRFMSSCSRNCLAS